MLRFLTKQGRVVKPGDKCNYHDKPCDDGIIVKLEPHYNKVTVRWADGEVRTYLAEEMCIHLDRSRK